MPIAKLLLTLGLGDVILCDRTGAIYEGRDKLNASKAEIAAVSNKGKVQGTLAEAVKGTDIFIGDVCTRCADPGDDPAP